MDKITGLMELIGEEIIDFVNECKEEAFKPRI